MMSGTPDVSSERRLPASCAPLATGRARFEAVAAALLFLAPASVPGGPAAPANDYSAVDAIFTAHCFDCHAGQDPEAQLVLENFETLMKGGESGPAIAPGKSADSLLVRMIEGRFEKDGKRKIMPPGKREKLSAAEILAIKSWINAGAPA